MVLHGNPRESAGMFFSSLFSYFYQKKMGTNQEIPHVVITGIVESELKKHSSKSLCPCLRCVQSGARQILCYISEEDVAELTYSVQRQLETVMEKVVKNSCEVSSALNSAFLSSTVGRATFRDPQLIRIFYVLTLEHVDAFIEAWIVVLQKECIF
jgi:hypothetical protein